MSENHTLAVVAMLVPGGVVCLISALQFHGLTTQIAHEVWPALPNKAWTPKLKRPKVYSPAKTVADCFKFRNKVRLDVALVALRDCWRQRKATMDQLWAAAKVCRMHNVMRPYLEAVLCQSA